MNPLTDRMIYNKILSAFIGHKDVQMKQESGDVGVIYTRNRHGKMAPVMTLEINS